MKKIRLLALFIFISISNQIVAQGPGCPNVDAGADTSVDCTTTCVDLTASFLQTGETDAYGVTSIPYAPPFPYTGLANPISVNQDDVWSGIINLPFDFCFFGDVYNQIQVGSNGVIRFEVNAADTSNGWSFSEDLPNNTNTTLSECNIFGVGHDIDPSVTSSNPDLAWDITGTAPCRTFVVSFANVAHFSCNNLVSTSMIVLYETTNAIEVYVQDKPTCTTWNSGNAVIGIQNNAGTIAYVPPGRNTSDSPWTATNEAWRFTPDGSRNYVFNWYDDAGNDLGDANTINVCPSSDTVYTAEVVYTNCNGDVTTVTDDVLVTAAVPFTVDIGPDQDFCEGDPDVTLNADIGSGTATYQWALDSVDITGETNSTITISSPNSGTYTVTVSDQGCDITDDAVITFHSVPTINPIVDYLLCDDAVVDGFTEFDLSTKDLEVLGAQTGMTVTYHATQADADANTNPLTNLYTNTTNPQTIFVRIENDNNTTCYNTTTFDLFVTSGITANQPADMIVCDDVSNDGIESFDLTTQTTIILGGQTGVTVSYHESQVDADSGNNPLTSPYSNISNPQIIYVRVEDDVNNACFDSTTFQLIVDAQPIANPATNMEVCDDGSNDGVEVFDLTTQTLAVLGTQASTDFTVTYFETQSDADANTNPITNPTTYSNTSSPQTVYVRIENNSNTACYDTATFTLTVNPAPTSTQPADLELCDDVSADGVEIFDLTVQTSTIIGSQTGVTVSYYETQVDADAGVNPITTPANYSNVTNPQVIFIRVEDVNSGCFNSLTTFTLHVNGLPQVVMVTPLEGCDLDGDGFVDFMLTDKISEVLNGQTGISVTFHESQLEADSGASALSSPYTNLTDPQTVYVRLEDTVTGCYDTTSFDLNVNPLPVPVVPTPLEECDDDNDGFVTTFDLESKTAEILGGQTGLTVTYHETQANADNGVNPLTSPYANIVANVQPIYVRVEDDITGCYDTVVLNIIVNGLPDLDNITSYELCDYNNPGDGIEQFDLTAKDTEIANGQVGLTITYHETQADADANANAIVGLYSNTSNPQDVYVRAENANGCVDTGSFQLLVNPLPEPVVPTPLELCDDNTPDGFTAFDLSVKDDEVRGGDPDLAITYYETQADADASTNALALPYTNTSNPQTIYVRAEDINTGCYATVTLDLLVSPSPTATVPTPMEFCDPDSDGFGEFMLTDADSEVTGGNTSGNLSVTYHETMSDADNNVNALSSPYNNIVDYSQDIYVRLEDVLTGCYNVVVLQLIVHDTPDITDPPAPLEVCDDNTDGYAQFDLTSKDTEVLNGLDPVQYTVSYYVTQANAEAGTNAISNPAAYTNITANVQTVWVRVDDTSTGCYSVTTLELVVNALPALVQPTPLSLCDYDNPGDEVEMFTLEDSVDEILNGQTGITVTFHFTQVGADTGTDQIFSPYSNVANAQTVYVRGENDVTGCVETITLDLRVEPLPSPAVPTPLEVCDDDNDGFAMFDLESKTLEILNGEPDVSITYHETEDDANNGLNALVSPYANIVEDSQMVYVRAENDITGCYTVVQLQLNVQPAPEVPLDIDDYVVCDGDSNGFAQFDLTTMDAVILGGQLPSDFVLTYHISQADADTGNNPIVNVSSYTNLSNPQTIYVRLEGVANGCVSTGEFDLVVALPPEPIAPTPLDVCDDDYYDDWDGMAVFDLTQKDLEITGGDSTWTVEYYETNADAQSGSNMIDPADAYTNTVNPQTLHVRVIDGDTGCYAFTTLTIRVNQNPTPEMPEPIELCDDVNTGDGLEVFDLTERENDIINGEGGVSATYHETLSDAESGANAIVDPTAYTNTDNPQTIYVRVTNDVTGCYTIVELEIIVNPLPEPTAMTDMVACEVNTDGFAGFDLGSKTDEALNGQDASVFQVTYHAGQTDAQDGINALVSPYTNVTNPQTIYVNITNTVTGCNIATMSFNIEVQEGAVANMPAMDYVICDNLGDNDGLGQFNLSDVPNGDGYDYVGDLYAEILGGQDPAGYTVSFYDSPESAEAGVDPIPTTYENTSNPQVIYVRVDNDSTVCYDTTAMTLRVDLLPIFDLDDSYVICVDLNGTETIETPPTIDTGLSGADYTFEWTDSTGSVVGTGATFVPSVAGTYAVLVTDNVTGCQESDETLVEQSSPPTVEAIVTTLAFSDQHVIMATATGDGDYEFSLDGGSWVSNVPNDNTYTFGDVSAGDHTVYARDINGCGMSEDHVLVVDYPLFFTPNSDTYNDTWNIIGLSGQIDAKIYIFDRYGKLLKQLAPNGGGWDGTYNGSLLPSDDYWFVVEYLDPADGKRKQFRAHFSLKR